MPLGTHTETTLILTANFFEYEVSAKNLTHVQIYEDGQRGSQNDKREHFGYQITQFSGAKFFQKFCS